MKPKVALEGSRFGRLTVVSVDGLWRDCICDCGRTCRTKGCNLNFGSVKSCGCALRHHIKRRPHSESRCTRLYRIYHGMKTRCYNPRDTNYKNWGGRGIRICAEWLADFDVFAAWARSSGYADDLSIDRINKDSDYEPSNCRWATAKQQAHNIRTNHNITAFGETKPFAAWLEDPRCVVARQTLRRRLRHLPPEVALTTPPRSRHGAG